MHYNYIRKKQIIKASITEAWDFFSNPNNLAALTPKSMNFLVTSEPIENIYEGQIITYKVSPILGIPMKWVTEITHVKPPFKFIDNQLIGPYKLWHHQHHFKPVPEGTLMTDIVYYSVSPFHLGGITDQLFIRKQLNNIFDYRHEHIEKLFNQISPKEKIKMTV